MASLASLVQQYESGGNYTATNPKSTASGAYQFTNGTWQQYASQIGVDTSAYPTAASAPPQVQDSVFAHAVSVNGLNDWTCSGCNPALSSYLTNNPGATDGLPVLDNPGSGYHLASGSVPDTGHGFNLGTAAQNALGVLAGPLGFLLPAVSESVTKNDPVASTGTPQDVGLTPTLTSNITSWLDNTLLSPLKDLGVSAENWGVRGGLLLVGVVLLAVAAAAVLSGGRVQQIVKGAVT
jgi:hypothetical protein